MFEPTVACFGNHQLRICSTCWHLLVLVLHMRALCNFKNSLVFCMCALTCWNTNQTAPPKILALLAHKCKIRADNESIAELNQLNQQSSLLICLNIRGEKSEPVHLQWHLLMCSMTFHQRWNKRSEKSVYCVSACRNNSAAAGDD